MPQSSPTSDGAARPRAGAVAQPPARRIPFVLDVFNGAVLGDFAREVGAAGAVTQVILGFIPGVGTVCAIRDCIADHRRRDRLGFWLNVLALAPFLGGFPKTAEVLRALRHVRRAVRVMR
jgi:hypothetical protein